MSDLRDAKHVIWDFSDNIVYNIYFPCLLPSVLIFLHFLVIHFLSFQFLSSFLLFRWLSGSFLLQFPPPGTAVKVIIQPLIIFLLLLTYLSAVYMIMRYDELIL